MIKVKSSVLLPVMYGTKIRSSYYRRRKKEGMEKGGSVQKSLYGTTCWVTTTCSVGRWGHDRRSFLLHK
jgi:hypothetical protein